MTCRSGESVRRSARIAFVSRDNALEVYQESTALSSRVIVSHLQSGRFGTKGDLR
jgi:hypothetical protein